MSRPSKLFLIVVVEIGFTLLLSVLGGLLALVQFRLAHLSTSAVAVTTSIAITVSATYFTLISLSHMFVADDMRLIPPWLSLIAVLFGALAVLVTPSITTAILNLIVVPFIEWIVPYKFLRNKFG